MFISEKNLKAKENLKPWEKLKTQEKTQKLKEKTQRFGKSIWSSCRKQVQFLSLN